jgi:hypothetical protein
MDAILGNGEKDRSIQSLAISHSGESRCFFAKIIFNLSTLRLYLVHGLKGKKKKLSL